MTVDGPEPAAEAAEPAEQPQAAEQPQEHPVDDESVRTLVARLSRPHRSGGAVVERAALQAEGADLTAVLQWITDHGGRPEAPAAPKRAAGGLHGLRGASEATRDPVPLRFVLPPGALDATTTKESP